MQQLHPLLRPFAPEHVLRAVPLQPQHQALKEVVTAEGSWKLRTTVGALGAEVRGGSAAAPPYALWLHRMPPPHLRLNL